jgi:hypothetical protein
MRVNACYVESRQVLLAGIRFCNLLFSRFRGGKDYFVRSRSDQFVLKWKSDHTSARGCAQDVIDLDFRVR